MASRSRLKKLRRLSSVRLYRGLNRRISTGPRGLYSVSGPDCPARRYMRHISPRRESCSPLPLSLFLRLPSASIIISATIPQYPSASRSRGFVSSEFRPRIAHPAHPPLRVLSLSFSRRGILLRPNDDVTLVHDSPRRITSGFLFPSVQNEKSARKEGPRKTGAKREGDKEAKAHRKRLRPRRRSTRTREQPSLTELLPLRSLHSREAVVYAPRHPTDAELMILINVS